MPKSTTNEQPMSKRVKVTLACTICRKKKVKCDGVQPSCSRCQSIGICCQYSDPPKKRGPPKGYVEVIENRAHRIESLLVNKPVNNDNKSLYNNNNLSVATVSAAPYEHKSNNTNVFHELIIDAVSLNLHGRYGTLYDFLMQNNVLITSSDESIWIDSFFGHFNSIFPILSRPQFNYQYEKTTLNPVLKLAVLLLGSRLLNNDHHTHQEQYLFQQFDYMVCNNSDEAKRDISIIQALAIMCWYTFLAGDLNKCNFFRLQLEKLIIELDFGNEDTRNHQHDMHYTEMKRRAFWVSFVIDTWLSSCIHSQGFISNHNENRQWTCKYPQLEDNQLFALFCHQLQQKNTISCSFSVEYALQINTFHEMIKLAQIVQGFLSTVATDNNMIISLETSLTKWLLHLPCYLDYDSSASQTNDVNIALLPCSPIAKIYRILYYTVQIMLNQQQKQSNSISNSICTTAANSIAHITEQMLQQEGQKNYLYNVFFLSLTLATSIHLDISKDNYYNNFQPLPTNKKISSSLSKSISMMKEINCSLLSKSEFSQLLEKTFSVGAATATTTAIDDFMPNSNNSDGHYFSIYPTPTTSSSSSSSSYNTVVSAATIATTVTATTTSTAKKRPLPVELVDQEAFTYQELFDPIFDINDIFPTSEMTLLSETTNNNNSCWVVDLFDIESSTTTCSPASLSHGYDHSPPLLSLPIIKQEQEMQQDYINISLQQQFHIFPSLLI